MLANVERCCWPRATDRRQPGYARWTATRAATSARSPAADKAFLRTGFAGWRPRARPASPPSPRGRRQSPTPTAELRPREATQTDEADLMPYEVLDAIERAAIATSRRRSCISAARRNSASSPTSSSTSGSSASGYATSGNASARPSFHLDDENLDRRPGAAPDLSGGFERELEGSPNTSKA